MKVLLCNTTDNGGGAAIAAHRLLEGLNINGTDASMLVLSKFTQNEKVIDANTLNSDKYLFPKVLEYIEYKLRLRIRKKKWAKYPNRDRVMLSDIYIGKLKNKLIKLEFELLHLHWVENDFINFSELQSVNKPIVWTLHGCFPFTGICHYYTCNKNYMQQCGNCPILKSSDKRDLSNKMFRLKEKRYKNLDLHIITPSRWMADRAKESSLFTNRPIHIIPNGIDTNVFKPVDKEIAKKVLNIPIDKKVILYAAVSAISDERKGYAYLKEALLNFRKQNKINIELLIIGEKNNKEQQNSIFPSNFIGKVVNEKLMTIAYNAADITIVPSKFENLPNIIMESLSCATPVVAFNIGGNSDMIDHKINGYLSEPYNVKDMAMGIDWCLNNNKNNELGINGRKKVLDKFDLKIISARHNELYDQILNKKNTIKNTY